MIRLSKHIKGAKYCITESTDMFREQRHYFEMMLFKYNLKATVFDYVTDSEAQNSYLSGVLDFGIYTNNAQAQLLAENPTLVDTYIADVTTTRNGKVPNVFSYALGDLSYFNNNVLKSRFLGGRNSYRGNNKVGSFSFREQTYMDMICRDNTFRWNYYTPIVQGAFLDGNQADGISALTNHIAKIKANNGWFKNFMHWHWNIDENAGTYFDALSGLIDEDCISANYSDVVEWYWLRNSIVSITELSSTKFQIKYAKNQPINYDLVSIPLYVDVNTKGTSLEGSDIKTTDDHKIYKKGVDKYTIEIPLDFAVTNKTITLEADVSENYVNVNVPIVSVDGVDLTSDQPIRIAIFRKTKAQTEDNLVLLERQNTLESTKTLPVFDTVTYDYYIGFINENRTSGVVQI